MIRIRRRKNTKQRGTDEREVRGAMLRSLRDFDNVVNDAWGYMEALQDAGRDDLARDMQRVVGDLEKAAGKWQRIANGLR